MKIIASRNLVVVFLQDIILIIACFYLAHLIRYDFVHNEWEADSFFNFLPYVIGCKVVCFYFFDLYKGMWRYTSLNDFINIIKASLLATFILIALVLYKTRFIGISRSVFVIDWCFTVLSIASSRLMVRLCFESFTERITIQDIKSVLLKMFKKNIEKGRGALIIGAGDYGQKVCREFNENPSVKSHVLGFLDDDKAKIGRKIHGIPVLNIIDKLEQMVQVTGAHDVIIAIPTLSAVRMRHIVDSCKKADVNFKTIPNLGN